jgi:spore coat polysaccharide biosynthesis predicted glycosyltransferase SpsG
MAHAGRLNVSVAIGAGAAHAAAVAKRASEMKHTELLPEREDLIAAYERFDFAIGAPGVSQFERACCGVPSILIAQNERQVPLARAWAKTGAAMRCDPTPDAVATAVATLPDDPATLPAMRERGLSLVDGKGAMRLAAELNNRLAS